MSNTYENVIPATAGTVAWVQRVPGEHHSPHTVVAWASVDGGPLEALIDHNEVGELVPMSTLRERSEDVYVAAPWRNDPLTTEMLDKDLGI